MSTTIICALVITLGVLGIFFTDMCLLTDKDECVLGVINIVCTLLLCMGIILCNTKTQTVYCPECGDKKDPIVVDIGEHYCSGCGTEYIVVD